jgi:hypothetical protein
LNQELKIGYKGNRFLLNYDKESTYNFVTAYIQSRFAKAAVFCSTFAEKNFKNDVNTAVFNRPKI